MAIEITKFVDAECDNVKHDIGMRIVEQIVEKHENEMRDKDALVVELQKNECVHKQNGKCMV